MNNNTALIKKG